MAPQCRHGKASGGQCTCDLGYTGDTCDDVIVCKNGGSLSKDGRTCRCPTSHEGPSCEVQILSCRNGQWNNSTHKCDCKDTYYGKHCERHKGRCHYGHWNKKEHYCVCQGRYSGYACDKLICQNGGTFIDGACSCPILLGGKTCTLDFRGYLAVPATVIIIVFLCYAFRVYRGRSKAATEAQNRRYRMGSQSFTRDFGHSTFGNGLANSAAKGGPVDDENRTLNRAWRERYCTMPSIPEDEEEYAAEESPLQHLINPCPPHPPRSRSNSETSDPLPNGDVVSDVELVLLACPSPGVSSTGSELLVPPCPVIQVDPPPNPV